MAVDLRGNFPVRNENLSRWDRCFSELGKKSPVELDVPLMLPNLRHVSQ